MEEVDIGRQLTKNWLGEAEVVGCAMKMQFKICILNVQYIA